MAGIGFAQFDTPLGPAAIAWTDRGVLRTWTYGHDADRMRARLRAALPQAVELPPPADVSAAIDGILALFGGAEPEFSAVQLDTSDIPDFDRRVYEQARRIRFGQTVTYGEIARAMGEEPMAARDVGAALSRNPFAPIVPCHRVVAAGGRLGGFSAPGGSNTKRRLLELEGALAANGGAGGSSGQLALFDAVPPRAGKTADTAART